jgi:pimeloyl-ACP methyl ester carboxylesterase
MLNNIKSSSDNGIILLEAKKESEKNSLILKILDRKNGEKEMIRQELPLIISKVEKMFTSVNLRASISGGAAAVTPAENVPARDELRVKKHFVFVHGYNVNANQARGWNSEAFKRTYWSGSLADFHGASWNGSETQYVPLVASLTVDYHANVLNAFKSAASLSDYLNSLNNNASPVTIAAHSLGNMLVSSAIADHGAKVTNYLMLDAAVASEAYDGVETKIQDMWRSEWGGFYNAWNGAADEDKPKYYRLIAAGWHSLFDNSDARSKLTWKDRFENNPNNVNFYNFYSSGEEVLDTHAYGGGNAFEGDASLFAYIWATIVQSKPPTGRYAWAFQEKLKGTMESNFILGSYYGGWAFNLSDYHNGVWPFPAPYTPEQALALTDDELKAKPFFNASGPHAAIYDSNQATASAHAGNYLNRSEILARMIPALTPATGKTSIKMFNPPGGQSKNIDMQASFQTGWPREREDNPIPRLQRAWYHSDLIDIAYIYINRLYSNLVEIGKLNKE